MFCRVTDIQSGQLSSYKSSYPQQIYHSNHSTNWNYMKLPSFNILQDVRILAFNIKTMSS